MLNSKCLHIGEVYGTNNYGDIIIIEYNSYSDVLVRFIGTGFETKTNMSNIRKGNVKDRLSPSVYDVGIVGAAPTKQNGKTLLEYKIWKGVMQRCYSQSHKKLNPSYLNCIASENFKNFTFFSEWATKQIGFDSKFDIDKDILGCGSVYSEDVCVFVPREVNLVFTKRVKMAKGVCFDERLGKFAAQICDGGGNRRLGLFYNETEAKLAYLEEKTKRIEFLAEKYKHSIDYRVYIKLLQLTKEI